MAWVPCDALACATPLGDSHAARSPANESAQIHFVYKVEELDDLIGVDRLPPSLGGTGQPCDTDAWCSRYTSGFEPTPFTEA